MNDGAQSETNRRIMLKLTLGLYGIMAALSVAWGLFRDRPNVWYHPEPLLALPWYVTLPAGAAAGAALGYAVSLLSVWMSHRVRWARELMEEFRGVLGGFDTREILMIAALSSLGEELFFRGVLLAETNLTISSLAFGLLHVPTSRRMIPWTLQAIAMGFLLGLLYLLSGDLTVCVATHFVINARNLRHIQP
jgi:hypothetical protein